MKNCGKRANWGNRSTGARKKGPGKGGLHRSFSTKGTKLSRGDDPISELTLSLITQACKNTALGIARRESHTDATRERHEKTYPLLNENKPERGSKERRRDWKNGFNGTDRLVTRRFPSQVRGGHSLTGTGGLKETHQRKRS